MFVPSFRRNAPRTSTVNRGQFLRKDLFAMIKKLAFAAALATTVLALPVNAGTLRLGTLDCTIDGGVGYVITSNKGVSCTFRPYHHGPSEQYTGMISKLGVDVGQTH